MSGALAVVSSGVTASAIGSIGSASSDRFITVFAGTIVIVNSTTSAGSNSSSPVKLKTPK